MQESNPEPYPRYTIENIRSSQSYQEQLQRSREYAINNKLNNVLVPPKLIDEKIVEFYGSEKITKSGPNNDKFGKWLTNCTTAVIVVNGIQERSTEHYFQRQKFLTGEKVAACNEDYREYLATLSPVEVARAGRTRDYPIRNDWEEVKYAIMWKGLVEKFKIEEFRSKLLETGDRVLVERSPNDKIWAINNDGEGENYLGLMLMAIRDNL